MLDELCAVKRFNGGLVQWETLRRLIEFGRDGSGPSRSGDVSAELVDFTAVLMQPRRAWAPSKVRKLSYEYACGELAWYLAGLDDEESITYYARQYSSFTVNGIAPGAYGPRIVEQIPRVIGELEDNPLSRRAVITLNDGQWDVDSPDVPCTLSLQYLIRHNGLYCITTMRSNDAWLGFPYDIWSFSYIQQLLAAIICEKPGPYIHHVGSMHLYKRNNDKAEAWAKELRDRYDHDYIGPLEDLANDPESKSEWNHASSYWTVWDRFRTLVEQRERFLRTGYPVMDFDRMRDDVKILPTWVLKALYMALELGLMVKHCKVHDLHGEDSRPVFSHWYASAREGQLVSLCRFFEVYVKDALDLDWFAAP